MTLKQQQQSLELVLVSANNNLYKNFAGFNMTKIFSYMRNANLFVHIFFFEFTFFLRRRTVINRNTNQQYQLKSSAPRLLMEFFKNPDEKTYGSGILTEFFMNPTEGPKKY